MIVFLFVDLLVIFFVLLNFAIEVRICCADKPVPSDMAAKLVTNDPAGMVMPCHCLSVLLAMSRQ